MPRTILRSKPRVTPEAQTMPRAVSSMAKPRLMPKAIFYISMAKPGMIPKAKIPRAQIFSISMAKPRLMPKAKTPRKYILNILMAKPRLMPKAISYISMANPKGDAKGVDSEEDES